MSKSKRLTHSEPQVSKASPENILRDALQQHPEIRHGLQYLLEQGNGTPVLLATLSSKGALRIRKSLHETWKSICDNKALDNKLGDSRELQKYFNQTILWLTDVTRGIIASLLESESQEVRVNSPTKPPVTIGEKKKVKEKKVSQEWGNAFFPDFPNEHNAVLFFHIIYRAGGKGVSRSTAMQEANLNQMNGSKFVDRQIALGLIEDIGGSGKDKGTEKRTPIYRLTNKGKRLQPEIFEHYKEDLVEKKGWINDDGSVA